MFVLRWYSTTGAAADLTRLCLVDKTLKWSRSETVDLLGRLVKTRLISRLEGRRLFTGMRPRTVKIVQTGVNDELKIIRIAVNNFD